MSSSKPLTRQEEDRKIQRIRERMERQTDMRLHEVPISKTVSYRYIERNGEKIVEGLVASNCWYPVVQVKGRYYFGLRKKNNKFVPGIVCCGRFVPGIAAQKGFLPGIISNGRFVPGIVAGGSFIPGMIKGKSFVPGIIGDASRTSHLFFPGCMTEKNEFILGIFSRGVFNPGVFKDNIFTSGSQKIASYGHVSSLIQQGYGVKSLINPLMSMTIGGLPINGMVIGAFSEDTLVVATHGMLTDKAVLMGGLGIDEPLTVPNLMNLQNRMGIDITDEMDGTLFGSLGSSGINGNLGIGIIDGFGGLPSLNDPFSQLSGGNSSFFDGINKEWDDYMQGVFQGYGLSEMVSGSGGNQPGGTDKPAKKYTIPGGAYLGFKAGFALGSLAGPVVAAALGAAGAVIGAALGSEVGETESLNDLVETMETFVNDIAEPVRDACKAVISFVMRIFGGSDKDEKPKPGSGTSASDEDGSSGDKNTVPIGSGSMAPPHVSIPRNLLFETSMFGGEVGSGDALVNSLIKFVKTDSGTIVVMNWDDTKKSLISSEMSKRGEIRDMLTGEVKHYTFGPLAGGKEKDPWKNSLGGASELSHTGNPVKKR